MSQSPHSVSIVLDRNYGAALEELAKVGPVWIVDSTVNNEIIQKIWAESPNQEHPAGVTSFKASNGRAPEQMLFDWMDTIDLHHGSYSANPPYTILRVIGSKLTPEIRQFLGEFGFDSFTSADSGFHATRPLPAEAVT